MSISKSQLDAIASGVLDEIGQTLLPDLSEGGALKTALERIMQLLVDDLRDSATMKGVVATKELRSSIIPLPAVGSEDEASVAIRMSSQWRYAEHGRRPGKRPPVSAIEEWITAKGIKPKRVGKQSTLDARKSLAYAIAKKIGDSGTIKRFGYKGSGFISSVLTEDYMRQMAEAIGRMAGKKIRLYLQG